MNIQPQRHKGHKVKTCLREQVVNFFIIPLAKSGVFGYAKGHRK
jgi:hypothetical protein